MHGHSASFYHYPDSRAWLDHHRRASPSRLREPRLPDQRARPRAAAVPGAPWPTPSPWRSGRLGIEAREWRPPVRRVPRTCPRGTAGSCLSADSLARGPRRTGSPRRARLPRPHRLQLASRSAQRRRAPQGGARARAQCRRRLGGDLSARPKCGGRGPRRGSLGRPRSSPGSPPSSVCAPDPLRPASSTPRQLTGGQRWRGDGPATPGKAVRLHGNSSRRPRQRPGRRLRYPITSRPRVTARTTMPSFCSNPRPLIRRGSCRLAAEFPAAPLMGYVRTIGQCHSLNLNGGRPGASSNGQCRAGMNPVLH